MCRTGGDFLVLSPIAPRSTYGILDRLGITCFKNRKAVAEKDRDIICRQVQIIDKDAFANEVESFLSGRAGHSFPDEKRFDEERPEEERTVEYIDEETNAKWYPVLDAAACLGCLECVGFCLFGVYTVDENNRPEVSVPDACRNGCPACARVCPGGAIMFPLHDDPAINGVLSAAEVQKENQNKNGEKNIAALLPSELEVGTRRKILNGLSDELDKLDELVNQTEDF